MQPVLVVEKVTNQDANTYSLLLRYSAGAQVELRERLPKETKDLRFNPSRRQYHKLMLCWSDSLPFKGSSGLDCYLSVSVSTFKVVTKK